MYYTPGYVSFISNNALLKKVHIKNPRFFDNNFNEHSINGQHIIHINDLNNQINYYKLPTTETI